MTKILLFIFLLSSCNVYDLVDGDIKVTREFEQALRDNPSAFASLRSNNGVSFSFGPQVMTTSSALIIPIFNNGHSDATSITGTVSTGEFQFEGGSYPGVMGDCSSLIMQMETCNISIEFNPAGSGVYTDTLQIDYFDGQSNKSLSISLNGVSNSPAMFNIVEGNPFYFSSTTIGSTSTQTVTLRNNGQTVGVLSGVSGLVAPFFNPGGTFPGTCSGNLAPGTQCSFNLDFSPTAAGNYNDNLIINYNDGLGPAALNLSVDGTGL